MRVQAALLARFAETDPESGLLNLVGGGLDVFGLNEAPAQFPVAFAVLLRFAESEADRTFDLTFVLRGPALEPVGEPTSFEITPRLGEYHAEGSEGTFTATGALRLITESVGTHSVSVQIDGIEAGVIPFQVLLSEM